MTKEQIISTVVVCIILLIVYYMATIPNVKRQRELKKMQDELKKGDKVITFSGLSGVVDKVEEDRVIVKLNPDGNKISFEKWAIAGLDDRTIKKG